MDAVAGDRSSALATSVILLMLLPVARHGRLAMLDGTQLSAMALLWLALLKLAQPDQRTWGRRGLMASAMLLLKAPLLRRGGGCRFVTGLGPGMEMLNNRPAA